MRLPWSLPWCPVKCYGAHREIALVPLPFQKQSIGPPFCVIERNSYLQSAVLFPKDLTLVDEYFKSMIYLHTKVFERKTITSTSGCCIRRCTL